MEAYLAPDLAAWDVCQPGEEAEVLVAGELGPEQVVLRGEHAWA